MRGALVLKGLFQTSDGQLQLARSLSLRRRRNEQESRRNESHRNESERVQQVGPIVFACACVRRPRPLCWTRPSTRPPSNRLNQSHLCAVRLRGSRDRQPTGATRDARPTTTRFRCVVGGAVAAARIDHVRRRPNKGSFVQYGAPHTWQTLAESGSGVGGVGGAQVT